MKRVSFFLIFALLLLSRLANGQEPLLYHFTFQVPNKSTVDTVSNLISIDNVVGNTVFAYANQKEFKSFKALGIAYSIIEDSKEAKALDMATTVAEMALWDRYPTYEVYEQMMQGFAASHPDICKLVEIGTLASGRKLLAVKISDNVNSNWEPEPQLFYTSSMHGDEIAGYIMMLRLIDELLNQYSNSTSPEITKLINGSVIWINPLANPNGTYKGGNQSVAGAIRYNNNYVDLNRNFPDPAAGNHPDGNSWQEETQFMRAFTDSFPISLSANFHSGTEVVNYPWDTWSALAADDLWWKYVGGNYRDSAQANSPVGYFNGVTNGLTNGYAWYQITGGRQDYMTYFKHGREFTVEISDSKLYPTSSLNNLWNYNRSALLGYLSEGLYGVQGTIVNGHGEPITATIKVLNHDFTHSEIYSQTKSGFFARYLKAGNYNFSCSAPGYADILIPNVTVVDGKQTPLHIIMNQLQAAICLSIDTIEVQLEVASSSLSLFLLKNCGNVPLVYTLTIEPDTLPKWFTVNKTENSIPVEATDTIELKFDSHSLMPGFYFSRLTVQSSDTLSVPVTLKVIPLQAISLIPSLLKLKITTADSIIDTVWIFNNSSETRKLKANAENNWLVLGDTSIVIAPNDSAPVSIYIPSETLNTGFYNTHVLFHGDARAKLPIEITVDTLPIIRLLSESSYKGVLIYSVDTDTVRITNIGGGNARLGIISDKDWLLPKSQELNVASGDTAVLILYLEVNELPKGVYSGTVTFTDAIGVYTYSLQINIDALPELFVADNSLSVLVNQGNIFVDTIKLTNIGGGKLHFEITEPNPNSWLSVDTSQGTIPSDETKNILLAFDAHNLLPGTYSSDLLVNGRNIVLKLTVLEIPTANFNKLGFFANLSQNQLYTDTLVISNPGSSILNYFLKIEDEVNQPWIQLRETSGTIPAGGMERVVIHFSSRSLPIGTYRTHLEVNYGAISRLPLVLQVNPAIK